MRFRVHIASDQLFFSSLFHRRALALRIKRSNALDILNIKAEICILSFVDCYIKLQITQSSNNISHFTFHISHFTKPTLKMPLGSNCFFSNFP